MRFLNVLIERSEHSTVPVAIGAWELPVLHAVHGEELVKVTGEVEVNRELPNAQQELERLARRYGVEEKSGTPFVNFAYAGARGVKDLALAIKESQEEAVEVDPTA